MEIFIRKADINDIYRIQDLNKKCLPIFYSSFEYLTMIMMSEYIILIAELNNIIIGYLVGELSKENFHILSFGVDNLHRNKGIGAVIIKKLIDLIKNECQNITLYVHVENIKAINFYEKNGFEKIERRNNYYQGTLKSNSQDAFKMIKYINKSYIYFK